VCILVYTARKDQPVSDGSKEINRFTTYKKEMNMDKTNFEPIKSKVQLKAVPYAKECKKNRFKDHRQSVKMLHKAANRRVTDLAEFGETRRNEIRDYYCSNCNGFHTTSKKTWGNPRKAA
jgi:hypothetical protein